MQVPTIDDVNSAAQRLEGKAFKTPLLSSATLNRVTQANVFLKPECLQRTGSFKFRGAYNAISRLSDSQKSQGVVASSSGNHAQGVAEASSIFGVDATIVMPSDAPKIKVKRTKRNGAKVRFYDRSSEDRVEVTNAVAEELGAVLVHPFNDHNVVAGQGTVGLEIVGDLNVIGQTPDRVLVCTGGGGLTAGVSLAIHHHFPEAQIHSVEPEGFDDYRRSLASGKQETNSRLSGSVCDAILTPTPGEIGFAINKSILSEGLIITDEDALEAVRFAYEELKLVVEPGGAAALAALLKAGEKWAGETIAVVISGGNVDPDLFAKTIAA